MQKNIKLVSHFPITVIGDSHILSLKDKVFQAHNPYLTISFDTLYIPGLKFENFIVDGNKINPTITNFLLQKLLISKETRPISLTDNKQIINQTYATGKGFSPSQIIFQMGDLSIKECLKSYLVSQNHQVIEQDICKFAFEYLEAQLKVFASALQQLRKIFGLRIYVHSICPITADDMVFEKINNYTLPSKLRGKIYKNIHSKMKEVMASAGIPFIDLFRELSNESGFLKDQYVFDGIHANEDAAKLTVSSFIDNAFKTRTAEASLRYVKNFLDVYSPDTVSVSDDIIAKTRAKIPISQIGVSDTFKIFNESEVDELKSHLGEFSEPFSLAPKVGWSSLPFEQRQNNQSHKYMKHSTLNSQGCNILYKKLFETELFEKLKVLFGANFSVIQVRPVHSLVAPQEDKDFGPQAFHYDNCPLTIFRGIIYLSDVTENTGPFCYKSKNDQSKDIFITGEKGTMFVFDANAVLHKGTSPKEKDRLALDLIILTHKKDKKNIVHSGEVGDVWPIDPYLFDLTENQSPSRDTYWFINPV